MLYITSLKLFEIFLIGTCLFQKPPKRQNIKKCVFDGTVHFKGKYICDGPSGQNKNHTVVRFLLNLCDSGRFQTITHNYPVRGHSFSPCDRDFGSMKRLLRKMDRIYTPDEYAELMLKASKSGRFTVYHLTSDDVLSFKKWWPKSYKKMPNSDETSGRKVSKENKEPFKASQYKQFLYNKDTRGKVVARDFIAGLTTSTSTLLKASSPTELPIEKAYPLGKVPINKKKIDDIKKLMEYTVGYEAFYDTIIQWPTTDMELPEDLPEAE